MAALFYTNLTLLFCTVEPIKKSADVIAIKLIRLAQSDSALDIPTLPREILAPISGHAHQDNQTSTAHLHQARSAAA